MYLFFKHTTQHNTTQGVLAALLGVIGVIVMTFMDSTDLNTQFLIYAIFFGVFGMGVGGEYPLTAMSASQHHSETMEEAVMEDDERRKSRCLVRSVLLCYIILSLLDYCTALLVLCSFNSILFVRLVLVILYILLLFLSGMYCIVLYHTTA